MAILPLLNYAPKVQRFGDTTKYISKKVVFAHIFLLIQPVGGINLAHT